MWRRVIGNITYNTLMVKATCPFKIFIKKWSHADYIEWRIWVWKSLMEVRFRWFETLKGTVMQIKKAMINDRLPVSKVSWRFRIPTIYNFAQICR